MKKLLKVSPIKLYERFVVEDILKTYSVTTRDAVKAVKTSRFYSALKKRPETVMHYPTEEWANSVANQHKMCRK